jgi:D-alanine-D-alanine ligase-like ATP-grasp enzyme
MAFRAALPTGLARLVARSGSVGRDLGARVDLATSSGPRYALTKVRENRRLRGSERDPNDVVYAEIWGEAAAAVAAQMVELAPGVFEFRREGVVARAWRHIVPLDDVVTVRVALDKTLAHTLVVAAGVPVPDHVEFDVADQRPAVRFMDSGAGPYVVKPAGGTGGGLGVTPGVGDERQLARAALFAGRRGRRLLIERTAPGDVYRFLFLDGELIDVVRRMPPQVTGDGRSTVAALIAAENRRRLGAGGRSGLPMITATLDCLFTLERQGLHLRSVPAPDQRVTVKTATSQSGPAENHTVDGPVAADLTAQARAAAEAVGLRLAGIDLVAPYLGSSLTDSGGSVIEVNSGPGLHHHYHVADMGRATRVAIPVLSRMLQIS